MSSQDSINFKTPSISLDNAFDDDLFFITCSTLLFEEAEEVEEEES